jgi:hypothetical protein
MHARMHVHFLRFQIQNKLTTCLQRFAKNKPLLDFCVEKLLHTYEIKQMEKDNQKYPIK